MLKTPVAFILFNRPDVTSRVFEEIRRARPSTLLLIADGPRPHVPGEADQCAQARSIVSRIDWPCELLTNYSEQNLGCKLRVSSGLDWVFQQVEEAIIIEDDCLPDPSFFAFCQALLERYRNDPRVMHITGDNFQPPGWSYPYSYYFSRYASIWGWATWRRAWKLYDVKISRWPEMKASGWLSDDLSDPREVQVWTQNFDRVYAGNYDTWDHQWTFTCFSNGGLAVTPAVNLVKNIGFGAAATHTTTPGPLADRATGSIVSITHPPQVERSRKEDDFVCRSIILGEMAASHANIKSRARRLITRAMRRIGLHS
jgi:hypothetical protein